MADASAGSLRLSRDRRIKQRRDFSRAKAEGKRMAQGCLAVNWVVATRDRASRLGVITSRQLGGAVARNRARRLLREVFRLHQHELGSPLDLVLIARPSIRGKTLSQVEADFLGVLDRGKLLKKAL